MLSFLLARGDLRHRTGGSTHFCTHGLLCSPTFHSRPITGSFCSPEGSRYGHTFRRHEPDAGTRVSKFKDYGCIVPRQTQSGHPGRWSRRREGSSWKRHDVIRSCCTFHGDPHDPSDRLKKVNHWESIRRTKLHLRNGKVWLYFKLNIQSSWQSMILVSA